MLRKKNNIKSDSLLNCSCFLFFLFAGKHFHSPNYNVPLQFELFSLSTKYGETIGGVSFLRRGRKKGEKCLRLWEIFFFVFLFIYRECFIQRNFVLRFFMESNGIMKMARNFCELNGKIGEKHRRVGGKVKLMERFD